jgi:hypothetical protein
MRGVLLMRRNDDLNAARGIINGIAIGLAVWLIILAVFAVAANAYEQSWVREAESLVAETAPVWGADTCADRAITVNVREIGLGIGGEAYVEASDDGLSTCSMTIDPELAARRCTFITVYAHERAHLWRDDADHFSDPNSLLFPGVDSAVLGRCHSRSLAITRRVALAAVRERIGSEWHLRIRRAHFDEHGTQTELWVTAKKDSRLRRYHVVNHEGTISANRWWY